MSTRGIYGSGYRQAVSFDSRNVAPSAHDSCLGSAAAWRVVTRLIGAILSVSLILLIGSPAAGQGVPIQVETVVLESPTTDAVPSTDAVDASDRAVPQVLVEVYVGGDETLTGIGLHLYFDGAALTLVEIEDLLHDGLIGHQLKLDNANSDNDPMTDSYLNVAWLASEGAWPSTDGARRRLLRARFQKRGKSATFLRVTTPTLPPGRWFEPSQVRVSP